MKLLLYILLLVLLLPVFIVGFCFYLVPILWQRGRVSGTAYEPFNGRLLYHLWGSRPDEATLQLARGLPAANGIVMALMIKPMVWASRVSSFVPSALTYPPPRPSPMSAMVGARCEFLDQALLDAVPEVDQIVILGAGWDTRAYGLLKGQGVEIFEVDAPATQAVKLAAIDKSGLDAAHVTFASCDFNRQSWLDALTEHGFDPGKRTFVLWEGVTMYLEEHAIQSTLRAVAGLPTGSRVAFDFLSREWLEDTRAGRLARWAVGAFYGEPFTFGFPVTSDFARRLNEYLAESGLAVECDRPLGREGTVPYGGLVLAMRGDGPLPPGDRA